MNNNDQPFVTFSPLRDEDLSKLPALPLPVDIVEARLKLARKFNRHLPKRVETELAWRAHQGIQVGEVTSVITQATGNAISIYDELRWSRGAGRTARARAVRRRRQCARHVQGPARRREFHPRGCVMKRRFNFTVETDCDDLHSLRSPFKRMLRQLGFRVIGAREVTARDEQRAPSDPHHGP